MSQTAITESELKQIERAVKYGFWGTSTIDVDGVTTDQLIGCIIPLITALRESWEALDEISHKACGPVIDVDGNVIDNASCICVPRDVARAAVTRGRASGG